MPLLQVVTNLGEHELPENFVDDLSTFTAGMFNKPVDRWYTVVTPGTRMFARGSSQQPFVLLHNQTIGVFSKQDNPVYGQRMVDFVSDKLGIDKQRVLFVMIPAHLLQAGLRTLPYVKMPGQ